MIYVLGRDIKRVTEGGPHRNTSTKQKFCFRYSCDVIIFALQSYVVFFKYLHLKHPHLSLENLFKPIRMLSFL